MSQLVVGTVKKLRKLALKRPKTDQTADSGQMQPKINPKKSSRILSFCLTNQIRRLK